MANTVFFPAKINALQILHSHVHIAITVVNKTGSSQFLKVRRVRFP